MTRARLTVSSVLASAMHFFLAELIEISAWAGAVSRRVEVAMAVRVRGRSGRFICYLLLFFDIYRLSMC